MTAGILNTNAEKMSAQKVNKMTRKERSWHNSIKPIYKYNSQVPPLYAHHLRANFKQAHDFQGDQRSTKQYEKAASQE
jgi:hypothetical protein